MPLAQPTTCSSSSKGVTIAVRILPKRAISATTERDVDAIVKNNFVLSRDLWRFCAKRGRRLIYASSGATYGSGEAGFRGLVADGINGAHHRDDDFARRKTGNHGR